MYIIRPRGILTTPRLLVSALGAHGTKRVHGRYIPEWGTDFFLAYPRFARNGDDSYHHLHEVYSMNKFQQRQYMIAAGVRTPESYESNKCVVRPLRHSKGIDFTVVETGATVNSNSHYIAPLFPKIREFRAVFVKGRLCFTLLKQVPEGTPSDVPWNHAVNSRFVTITREVNDWLTRTSFYQDAERLPITTTADLVAFDVMMDAEGNYAVAEFNFCPGITIPGNLEKVKHHVQIADQL